MTPSRLPFSIPVSIGSGLAFVREMPRLGLALAVWAALLMVPALAAQKLSAPEARALVEAGEMVLLDIRSPQEWKETGIADVAEPVSLQDRAFIEKLKGVIDGNPGRRIGFICATGGRSSFVVTELEKRGLTGLVDVSEGMEGSAEGPGWVKRGLPIKRP